MFGGPWPPKHLERIELDLFSWLYSHRSFFLICTINPSVMLVCPDVFVHALNRHRVTPYLSIARRILRDCFFVRWNIDLHALSVVFSRLFQLKLHLKLLWCIKYILLPKLWKYLEYVQLDNFPKRQKMGDHLLCIYPEFVFVNMKMNKITRTYTGYKTCLQYTTALLGDI